MKFRRGGFCALTGAVIGALLAHHFHLNQFGVPSFVMRYNHRTDDPWLNAFASYVNQGPKLYSQMGLAEFVYRKYRKERLEEIDESQELLNRIMNGEKRRQSH